MAIPQEIVDAVRARSDLADLVSEYAALKRSGRNLVACCPFHEEKTPSFNVNSEEGFYKCFGCGKKGDVFSFLMEMRGFSFPEAVRFLGRRLGVEVPDSGGPQGGGDGRSRESALLRRVSAAVEQCFRAALVDPKEGQAARDYLRGRGLSQETVETFRLGFAPDGWEFLLGALERVLPRSGADAVSAEQLKDSCLRLGLVKERSSEGGCYDLFRGRIIFPIHLSSGAAVAFGARLLCPRDDAPKYLNSSESPIYHKRRTLYGIPQALSAMRQTRVVYLVEGYTDVLSLHQAGIHNVLASCGTSLTEEHAQVIKRLADRAIVLFDGDDAGRKAAAACFERFLNTGVAVKAAFMPQGEDPDSLVCERGAEALQRLIEERQRPVLDVYLDQQIAAGGLSPSELDPVLQGKVAERFARVVAGVINPVEREAMIRRACGQLGVGEHAMNDLIAEARSSHRPPRSRQVPLVGSAGRSFSERRGSAFGPQRSSGAYPSAAFPAEAQVRASHNSSHTYARGQAANPKHEYVRQLLISVISEPAQAKLVLSTPSLLGGQGLIEGLPEAATAVLRELSTGGYEGLLQLSSLGQDSEQRSEGVARLQELLSSYGLPAGELIAEGLRQCTIGGVEAKSVVADAARAAARSSLFREIEQLKLQEASAASPEELQRIAQLKLEARKRLDRVRSETE